MVQRFNYLFSKSGLSDPYSKVHLTLKLSLYEENKGEMNSVEIKMHLDIMPPINKVYVMAGSSQWTFLCSKILT